MTQPLKPTRDPSRICPPTERYENISKKRLFLTDMKSYNTIIPSAFFHATFRQCAMQLLHVCVLETHAVSCKDSLEISSEIQCDPPRPGRGVNILPGSKSQKRVSKRVSKGLRRTIQKESKSESPGDSASQETPRS